MRERDEITWGGGMSELRLTEGKKECFQGSRKWMARAALSGLTGFPPPMPHRVLSSHQALSKAFYKYDLNELEQVLERVLFFVVVWFFVVLIAQCFFRQGTSLPPWKA